jgi:site-specific recombinase XerD
MNTNLAHLQPKQMVTPARSTDKEERLHRLVGLARSKNTVLTYHKQIRYFNEWCQAKGLQFGVDTLITPEVIEDHIEDLHHQGKKLDTIKIRVRALAAWHKAQVELLRKQGEDVSSIVPPTSNPAVTTILQGIKNDIAEAQSAASGTDKVRSQGKTKAEALWQEDLFAICKQVDTSNLIGKRELALVLVGWAGGFRRSELSSITVENIQPTAWGYLVTLPKTKTGKKVVKQIRRESAASMWCPVRALEDWLEASKVASGYVFRSVNKAGKVTEQPYPDKLIEVLIKKLAAKAELRSGKWSAHSLRRGYVSQHLAWGVNELAIRRQCGFTATSPVFYEYVDEVRDHSEVRSGLSKPTA